MEKSSHTDIPLIYVCSGCSAAAQRASDLAVSICEQGTAEMSCITGVGGNVRSMVRKAKSGRRIIALEGCALKCVQQTLARHGVVPTWHIQMEMLGPVAQTWSLRESYQALQKIYRIIGRDCSASISDPLRH